MHKIVDIRRNDNVRVINGRDKGKEGRVLRVSPATGKVLVEHVMMVKKAVRKNPQKNVKGGIAEQESAIAISNVMLVCTSCKRPVRVAHEKHGDKHVRGVPALQDDVGEIWLMAGDYGWLRQKR
jgi:large subunit ribosomal protein L24